MYVAYAHAHASYPCVQHSFARQLVGRTPPRRGSVEQLGEPAQGTTCGPACGMHSPCIQLRRPRSWLQGPGNGGCRRAESSRAVFKAQTSTETRSPLAVSGATGSHIPGCREKLSTDRKKLKLTSLERVGEVVTNQVMGDPSAGISRVTLGHVLLAQLVLAAHCDCERKMLVAAARFGTIPSTGGWSSVIYRQDSPYCPIAVGDWCACTHVHWLALLYQPVGNQMHSELLKDLLEVLEARSRQIPLVVGTCLPGARCS